MQWRGDLGPETSMTHSARCRTRIKTEHGALCMLCVLNIREDTLYINTVPHAEEREDKKQNRPADAPLIIPGLFYFVFSLCSRDSFSMHVYVCENSPSRRLAFCKIQAPCECVPEIIQQWLSVGYIHIKRSARERERMRNDDHKYSG
jgi:hypothetical protein